MQLNIKRRFFKIDISSNNYWTVQQDVDSLSKFHVYNMDGEYLFSFTNNTKHADDFMRPYGGLRRWVNQQPDRADNE